MSRFQTMMPADGQTVEITDTREGTKTTVSLSDAISLATQLMFVIPQAEADRIIRDVGQIYKAVRMTAGGMSRALDDLSALVAEIARMFDIPGDRPILPALREVKRKHAEEVKHRESLSTQISNMQEIQRGIRELFGFTTGMLNRPLLVELREVKARLDAPEDASIRVLRDALTPFAEVDLRDNRVVTYWPSTGLRGHNPTTLNVEWVLYRHHFDEARKALTATAPTLDAGVIGRTHHEGQDAVTVAPKVGKWVWDGKTDTRRLWDCGWCASDLLLPEQTACPRCGAARPPGPPPWEAPRAIRWDGNHGYVGALRVFAIEVTSTPAARPYHLLQVSHPVFSHAFHHIVGRIEWGHLTAEAAKEEAERLWSALFASWVVRT